MIEHLNGFPPLPFPAIPTSYDESLSFMELVTKLWNAVSGIITAVNAISTQIENLPTAEEFQEVSDGLAAEIQNRQQADTVIQTTLTALINNIALEYISREELETDYMIGGVTFQIMTQAEYDALTEYTPKRVYFVMNDSDHITIKFGGSTVGTATVSGDFIAAMSGQIGGKINFVEG